MSTSTYWQRLRAHPGPPVALFLTLLSVIAADGLIGVLYALPWWALVLWTARTQPVEDVHDGETP